MEQPIYLTTSTEPSCPVPRWERAVETAEGLPGSCSGKPRGKPCPGTFHVIRSTQKSSPRVADSMGVGPAAQGTAVTGCAHQRKHRWATEQEGPTHPSLAPGPQSSTAPAPSKRVVGTEGRDVGKVPRQLLCSNNRVATIPTRQQGLHLQPAHSKVWVQQVLTLVTQKVTAPAHTWEPRQHPWVQRMHLFSQA